METQQQNNASNFLKGSIYPSIQEAILEIFQPNPKATRKTNKISEPMTKEEEQKFMQQNFPGFNFNSNSK